MKRILAKIALALLLVSILNVPFLAVSLADKTAISAEEALVTRVPGVKAGDWARYALAFDYSTTDSNPPITPPPPDLVDVDYYKLEVLSVNGSVINFQAIARLKNGTEIPSNMSTNVQGPSMGPPFFIAANLSAGDAIYPTPPSPTINVTLSRMYAGMVREVNFLIAENDANSPPGFKMHSTLQMYWDRATGIFDEWLQTAQLERISDHTMTLLSIHLMMTETNIWSPTQTHLQAEVFIAPRTLNIKSQGKWIIAFVVFPEGTFADQVDPSTIMLNSTVPAISFMTLTRLLIVKFDKVQVEAYISNNMPTKQRMAWVTLTINGKLENGTSFEGSTRIRVIAPQQ